MRYPTLKLVLGAALGLGLLVAARLVARPLGMVRLPPPAARTVDTTPSVRPLSLDTLAAATVTRDQFRVTHRPATTTYDPQRQAEPVVPPAPNPVLLLAGIVWGADPTALVEGFPGLEGPRVVRAGDVVSGLWVQSIGRDRVRIEGMDTTWVLRVREPLQ